MLSKKLKPFSSCGDRYYFDKTYSIIEHCFLETGLSFGKKLLQISIYPVRGLKMYPMSSGHRPAPQIWNIASYRIQKLRDSNLIITTLYYQRWERQCWFQLGRDFVIIVEIFDAVFVPIKSRTVLSMKNAEMDFSLLLIHQLAPQHAHYHHKIKDTTHLFCYE